MASLLGDHRVARRSNKNKSKTQDETFGRRLARLRRSKGLTQPELAEKLGISARMMAYYEAQTDRPPAHLLAPIAQLLGLSTDELLGVRTVRVTDPPVDLRLWRRLRVVETLTPTERKAVLDYIQLLLDRRKLRDHHRD